MSIKDKATQTENNQSFGSLGNVEIVEFNNESIDVYAKMTMSSGTHPAGPTFSDDCNLNPPLCGPAITF